MDLTAFIASHREALLIGDYSTYRAQLSRQIRATRRRLGIATPRRDKYAKKPVTAENVGTSHEYAHLFILTAERAWAHALHVKTSHSEETTGKGITGSTRSYIISRLHKAAKVAHELVEILQDRGASKAIDQDVLEGRAYAASLAGAEEFEKQAGGQRSADGRTGEKRWQACLKYYSKARVIYAAFLEKEKKDIYRDLLANTIDPTIRYAAYQAHLPRTIAIPTVARKYFPTDDAELIKLVEQTDPYALKDKPVPKTESERQAAPQDIPSSVNWRGRKANIVDASIGQALAAVSAAEVRLRTYLSSNPSASSREKAAAYDDILIASQDAADATKTATDELEKERVDEGDPRMQDLRVTSLSVNYDLVSWRVGRNRVLMGEDDGLKFEPQVQVKSKHRRKDGTEYPDKPESRGHQLGRLRERVVLYDAIIQSINSVKDLPGVLRDTKFVDELDGKTKYFRALKCLNIACSHSLLGNHLNALALLQRCDTLISNLHSTSSDPSKDAPSSLLLDSAAISTLRNHVSVLLSRTHALVEMSHLSAPKSSATTIITPPVVQNLYTYPPPGTHVDLTNLVSYPPKIEPVPVKPILLDVAWNYIEYPGRQTQASSQRAEVDVQPAGEGVNGVGKGGDEEGHQQKRRGWFGFGR